MRSKNAKVATLAATLITLGSLAGGANGAVILSTDNPAVNQHTIDLDPVTFTVTEVGTLGGLIFEDFFSTNNSSSGGHVSTSMTVSINGGAAFSVGGVSTNGTFSGTIGPLDANDLWFNIASGDEFTVTVGQEVTFAGTTIFSNTSIASLNPSFDQTAFLWEENSILLSNSTSLSAVPEPSSALFLGLGALGIVARRRRN